MDIIETRARDSVVLTIAGRIDSSASAEFQRHLSAMVERGENSLVLDFSSVDYISSAGLGAMLSTAKKLRTRSGSIALAGVNARVRQVFDMSGFTQLFPIYAEVTAALAHAAP
jgi:anti-anti-sigma factor